jgi:putative nucleotidyltransferase with HDIG domain
VEVNMSISEGWSRPLRSYLPQSLSATATLIGTPLLVVWVCTQLVTIELPSFLVFMFALALTGIALSVGADIWHRSEGSKEIMFSELFLWSWYRLQKAEARLAAGRRGVAPVDASPEEQLAALTELSTALEIKDPYTRGHSSRVERHAYNTALALGLSSRDLEALRRAASLHDVGKIRIPNIVLHKPGRLDEEERKLIEEHPVLGSWMVSSLGDEQITRTVRHHHERWDGAGYPDGIAGDEIPLLSRIIAVADTFDAITSSRSYRAGRSNREAMKIIRSEAGHQFDPVVVDSFLASLPRKLPLIAGVALLAGPQDLWRQLIGWLRRFGAGSLAPGAGAVGAAVVLGASTFIATTDAPPRPQVGRSAAAGSSGEVAPLQVSDPTDQVLGKRIQQGSKLKRAGDASRRSARSASFFTNGSTDVIERSNDSSGSGGSGSGTSGGGARGSGGVPPDAKPNHPTDPGAGEHPDNPGSPGNPRNPGDHGSPQKDPAKDDKEKKEPGDPQPEHGRDCEPGLGAESNGSERHCGDGN